MIEETCCFTGHRKLPGNKLRAIESRLDREVKRLIETGVREFLCGGALGFDTLAAMEVLRLREEYPWIRLVFVLPCRNQDRFWNEYYKSIYERIKSKADEIIFTSEYYYSGCMFKRNRALVERSRYCICYLFDTEGGTAYTVDYARKKGLDIINIY